MIVMEHWSRQHVVDELNRMGYTELAVEASRDLPDPVDANRLEAWGRNGKAPFAYARPLGRPNNSQRQPEIIRNYLRDS